MKKLVGYFLMVCFLLSSSNVFANRSNEVDLEGFLGEYELVEDTGIPQKKWRPLSSGVINLVV